MAFVKTKSRKIVLGKALSLSPLHIFCNYSNYFIIGIKIKNTNNPANVGVNFNKYVFGWLKLYHKIRDYQNQFSQSTGLTQPVIEHSQEIVTKSYLE